jgi:hypothetical protein
MRVLITAYVVCEYDSKLWPTMILPRRIRQEHQTQYPSQRKLQLKPADTAFWVSCFRGPLPCTRLAMHGTEIQHPLTRHGTEHCHGITRCQ